MDGAGSDSKRAVFRESRHLVSASDNHRTSCDISDRKCIVLLIFVDSFRVGLVVE